MEEIPPCPIIFRELRVETRVEALETSGYAFLERGGRADRQEVVHLADSVGDDHIVYRGKNVAKAAFFVFLAGLLQYSKWQITIVYGLQTIDLPEEGDSLAERAGRVAVGLPVIILLYSGGEWLFDRIFDEVPALLVILRYFLTGFLTIWLTPEICVKLKLYNR